MLPMKPVAANVTCCPGARNALLGFTVRISFGVSVVFVQPATDTATTRNERMQREYFRSNVLFLHCFSGTLLLRPRASASVISKPAIKNCEFPDESKQTQARRVIGRPRLTARATDSLPYSHTLVMFFSRRVSQKFPSTPKFPSTDFANQDQQQRRRCRHLWCRHTPSCFKKVIPVLR